MHSTIVSTVVLHCYLFKPVTGLTYMNRQKFEPKVRSDHDFIKKAVIEDTFLSYNTTYNMYII
jgi:hypothetical protein